MLHKLHKFVLHSFAIGVLHTFDEGGGVPNESLSVKLPKRVCIYFQSLILPIFGPDYVLYRHKSGYYEFMSLLLVYEISVSE